jgi:hypothetical protein
VSKIGLVENRLGLAEGSVKMILLPKVGTFQHGRSKLNLPGNKNQKMKTGRIGRKAQGSGMAPPPNLKTAMCIGDTSFNKV